MGVVISNMEAYFEFNKGRALSDKPNQVLSLAEKSLLSLPCLAIPRNISHLIVATSCPDMLAPSLGQMINEKYNSIFSNCHTIDIVQGCAGGVSAMILASQLAELNKSSVMVIQADAAKKATSKTKRINKIFGNGSFACLINYDKSERKLLHYKSRQYYGLSKVVTIKLGHDANITIKKEIKTMNDDPRKHLGLHLNNSLAARLFRKAEGFYIEFIKESVQPDMIILHQVNPIIMKHLKAVFAKYNMEFIDVASITGNCGAASVGIALNYVKERIREKKVMLCSFGTGGVITAGLWQN